MPAAACPRTITTSYEDSPDGSHVTAFFKPTTNSDSNATNSSLQPAGSEAVAVQAKVLVGCDGYFSRVRRQCLDDGLPQWDSTLLWRARLPAAAAAAAGVTLVDSSLFMQDTGWMLFAYPIASDVVWTVGCKGACSLRRRGPDVTVLRAAAPLTHPRLCSRPAPAADDKLSEMGLDPAAIKQQLSSGSATSKVQGSSAPEPLQTNGYCAQEVAAGEAAKARCLQAMAGVSPAVLQLIGAGVWLGCPGFVRVFWGVCVASIV
jgi:hypothetical protein